MTGPWLPADAKHERCAVGFTRAGAKHTPPQLDADPSGDGGQSASRSAVTLLPGAVSPSAKSRAGAPVGWLIADYSNDEPYQQHRADGHNGVHRRVSELASRCSDVAPLERSRSTNERRAAAQVAVLPNRHALVDASVAIQLMPSTRPFPWWEEAEDLAEQTIDHDEPPVDARLRAMDKKPRPTTRVQPPVHVDRVTSDVGARPADLAGTPDGLVGQAAGRVALTIDLTRRTTDLIRSKID